MATLKCLQGRVYMWRDDHDKLPRWSRGRKRDWWARGPGFDSQVEQKV